MVRIKRLAAVYPLCGSAHRKFCRAEVSFHMRALIKSTTNQPSSPILLEYPKKNNHHVLQCRAVCASTWLAH
ncbi:hypothetical protein PVAP13_2KG096064 [Panicum virgatum]|uniref:Uncharacterized protein n=1 Tax=Panicum virgatum TaxID=38727 RepID=A0A8T0W1A5_PANVG|nr:hypothetical protein PVAP13_2KG096064 [Panicum virgatum]